MSEIRNVLTIFVVIGITVGIGVYIFNGIQYNNSMYDYIKEHNLTYKDDIIVKCNDGTFEHYPKGVEPESICGSYSIVEPQIENDEVEEDFLLRY